MTTSREDGERTTCDAHRSTDRNADCDGVHQTRRQCRKHAVRRFSKGVQGNAPIPDVVRTGAEPCGALGGMLGGGDDEGGELEGGGELGGELGGAEGCGLGGGGGGEGRGGGLGGATP